MTRAWFHCRSAAYVIYLLTEPLITRILADAHGINRGRR